MRAGKGGRRHSIAASDLRAVIAKSALSLRAWLVLALVLEQPSHGYEIYPRFEQRLGALLPTSKSSMYAILNRLEARGMIEQIVIEPSGRARKQHESRRSYRVTMMGAQAFRRWVAGRMRDDPERLELLVRIVSVRFLGVDTVLEVIDRYEADCVQEMKALPASDPEDQDYGVAELVELLVLDQRRREVRARIDWATHARRILKAQAPRLAAGRAEES
jgi:DNA-binding PadR family transcriptional regulator